MGIGLWLQLREPRGAERCDRKAANERDDLIPFKGAEGAWVEVALSRLRLSIAVTT